MKAVLKSHDSTGNIRWDKATVKSNKLKRKIANKDMGQIK